MDAFLPYMAGFFDGEGYVYLQKVNRNHAYSLWVVVSNTNQEPLRLMKERWGGHLAYVKRHNLIQRDIYRLFISTNNAIRFLEEVLPYLIIKKPQAELALEFDIHVKDFKRRYRHVKGKKGIQPLPPEAASIRDDFVQRMKNLNRRGRVLEVEQVEESTLLATGLSITE